MKVLIIEDERAAVRSLKNILSQVDASIEVVDVLEGIADTVEWFGNNPMPDLIFMDIHLSDGSSFELFDRISITCPIIFTTAYDEYALRAFKVNSVDYLLKPIRVEDVRKALDKLDALISSSPHSESMDNIRDMVSALRNTSHFRSHFLIPSKGDRLIPLDVADVLYFYIVDGAVYAVTLRHEKILIPHTLDEVAASIDPSVFFRVNRQYIISRSAVKDMAVWFTGRLVVNLTVETEEKIIVSRQKVSDFKDWFAGLY